MSLHQQGYVANQGLYLDRHRPDGERFLLDMPAQTVKDGEQKSSGEM